MLADLQNIASDKQSIAAAAGTVVSTNVIDLRALGTIPQGGSPIGDVGRSPNIKWGTQITTTVTSGGAATIDFRLCQSANNDLSSPTVLASSGAVALATMVAGYWVPAVTRDVPPVTARYLGMNYVIATATTTAGNVWAGILSTRQTTPSVTA